MSAPEGGGLSTLHSRPSEDLRGVPHGAGTLCGRSSLKKCFESPPPPSQFAGTINAAARDRPTARRKRKTDRRGHKIPGLRTPRIISSIVRNAFARETGPARAAKSVIDNAARRVVGLGRARCVANGQNKAGAVPYKPDAPSRQTLRAAAFISRASDGGRGLRDQAPPRAKSGCVRSKIAPKRANIGHLSGINGVHFGCPTAPQGAKSLEFPAFAPASMWQK